MSPELRLRCHRTRSTCALLAAACISLAACEPPQREQPDIVLISLDSVRSDALDFRNANTAPTLAELAERGSVFRNATSGSSWTLPAHVQMLSGTPPALHGVVSDDLAIDPNTALLAEELQRAGYFTAGVFTGGYLWGDYGFDRGFDVYQSAINEFDLESHDSSRMPRDSGGRARALFTGANEGITSPLVVRAIDAVVAELETSASDKPAFVFLHLFDPHYDYAPPAPWDTRFDPDYSGDIDGRDFWTNTNIWDESKSPPRRIGDRDLKHLVALYRGEIGWTDSQLALIFQKLRRAGRLENALVIVTSDHGEEFFDHGGRGHRETLYDEVTRVPLLIAPPGEASASEVDAQVSLSDVLPTALDYAGVEAPASSTGRSLRPAIEGRTFKSRPAISTLYIPRLSSKGTPRHRFLHTLRTPEEKLSRNILLGRNSIPRLKEVAWYDLVSDPLERKPVRDPNDARVIAAWERMEAEFAALRETYEQLPHAEDTSRRSDMRDALFDQLKALGYVDDGPEGSRVSRLQVPWGLAPFPAIELKLDPPAKRRTHIR